MSLVEKIDEFLDNAEDWSWGESSKFASIACTLLGQASAKLKERTDET